MKIIFSFIILILLIFNCIISKAAFNYYDFYYQPGVLYNSIKSTNENDKSTMSNQLGFGLTSVINDKWACHTGISIKNTIRKTTMNRSSLNSSSDSLISSYYFDSPYKLMYQNIHYFLSIPFEFRYTFIENKKYLLGIHSGVSLDYVLYISSKEKYYYNSGRIERESISSFLIDYEAIAFSYLVGLDYNYKISSKTTLLIQPNYNFLFFTVEGSSFGIMNTNFGLKIGMSYSF